MINNDHVDHTASINNTNRVSELKNIKSMMCIMLFVENLLKKC